VSSGCVFLSGCTQVHRDAKVKADEEALGLFKKKQSADAAAAAASASSSSAAAGAAVSPMEDDEKQAPQAAAERALNPSGRYELVAVVTHQGRDADGGHYVGACWRPLVASLRFIPAWKSPCILFVSIVFFF
jgi:hypothetical protein